MEGWIKLHRKFKNWEWYKKSEMVHLFCHLLILANHKNNKWQGVEIKRGQLLTGLNTLNNETGISIQTLRTCIKKLKSTNEITIKSTSKYSIVTILNYDTYNDIEILTNNQINKQTNNQLTIDQQSINNQLTTNKNDKKEKNDNKIINISFDIFWNLYDKKVGDKTKCKKKWSNLKDDVREEIIQILPEWLKQFNDKQYQPHPATFLNQQRWNDEIKIKQKEYKPIFPSY